jgi:hypothetical protein
VLTLLLAPPLDIDVSAGQEMPHDIGVIGVSDPTVPTILFFDIPNVRAQLDGLDG